MLQTYIPYAPKNSTQINEKIAMDLDDGKVVFYYRNRACIFF